MPTGASVQLTPTHISVDSGYFLVMKTLTKTPVDTETPDIPLVDPESNPAISPEPDPDAHPDPTEPDPDETPA